VVEDSGIQSGKWLLGI